MNEILIELSANDLLLTTTGIECYQIMPDMQTFKTIFTGRIGSEIIVGSLSDSCLRTCTKILMNQMKYIANTLDGACLVAPLDHVVSAHLSNSGTIILVSFDCDTWEFNHPGLFHHIKSYSDGFGKILVRYDYQNWVVEVAS